MPVPGPIIAEVSKLILTAAEFESLKEVSKKGVQQVIPHQHKRKLLEMGLIAEKLGGPVLTPIGEVKVASGN